MIKNLAPLTYNKSFWLRHDDLSYNCFFAVLLEPDRCDRKKWKNSQKNQVFYQAISTVFTHTYIHLYLTMQVRRIGKTEVLMWTWMWTCGSDSLTISKHLNKKLFRVTVSGDQNVKKDGEKWGSELTNHEMIKFPERSEVCLFSLQEALCFYLNLIGSFIKKFDILCSQ